MNIIPKEMDTYIVFIVIMKNGRNRMLIDKKIIVKEKIITYQFEAGKLSGRGSTPREAVLQALELHDEIPYGLQDPLKAVKHIFEKHEPSDWMEIIRILIEDSF